MKTITNLIRWCLDNSYPECAAELKEMQADPHYAMIVGYTEMKSKYLSELVTSFNWARSRIPNNTWYEIYERLSIIEEPDEL